LRAYQQILSEIRALGAGLVAVSPQTPDHTAAMAEKNLLDFDVLSDSGNRVARSYGLVFSISEQLRPLFKNIGGIDLALYNGDQTWELPIPATYVIDREGAIHLAFVEADYTRRLEPSEILNCLRAISRH
jgi:peroxiredoxin